MPDSPKVPTEPSNEAVEAMVAQGRWPAEMERLLEAALPIERNRWEQEVRERLLELADKFEAAAGPNGPKQCQCCRKANKQLLDLAAAFGEAEPVEDCKRCDNTGWLCAECKQPRGKCTCGLRGASENGCPDCQRSIDPDAAEGEGRR